jgi:hypothetical protein
MDPSILFAAGAYATPLLVGDKPIDARAVIDYVCDPASLVGAALIIGAVLSTKLSRHRAVTLSRGESLIANWLLVNGAVFHVTLDFFCGMSAGGGMFNFLPAAASQYAKLDKRYGQADIGVVRLCLRVRSLEQLLIDDVFVSVFVSAIRRGSGSSVGWSCC